MTENKAQRITVRLTESEMKTLEEKATKSALTKAEYIRRCALGRKITAPFNGELVLALADLGREVKGFLSSELVEDKASIVELLKEIKLTILKVGK